MVSSWSSKSATATGASRFWFARCTRKRAVRRARLHAGARGYINKQEASKKVIRGLGEVLNGKIYLSPEMAPHVLARGRRPERRRAGQGESFSDRELAVFELIGQGLTTRTIAELLHLSVKTVETYREHIKAKLGLRNGAASSARHATQWVLEKR